MSTPKPGKPATQVPDVVPTKARTDKPNRHERQKKVSEAVEKLAAAAVASSIAMAEAGKVFQKTAERMPKSDHRLPEHLTQRPFGQHPGLRSLRSDMSKQENA